MKATSPVTAFGHPSFGHGSEQRNLRKTPDRSVCLVASANRCDEPRSVPTLYLWRFRFAIGRYTVAPADLPAIRGRRRYAPAAYAILITHALAGVADILPLSGSHPVEGL